MEFLRVKLYIDIFFAICYNQPWLCKGVQVYFCAPFFTAKVSKVQVCLHEIVFGGRKNMWHVVRNVRMRIEQKG